MKTSENFSAKISASTIFRLAPIVAENAGLCMELGVFGFHIFPDDVGCTIVATNGHAIGAVHDAEAVTTREARLSLPPDVIAACTPPDEKVFLDEEDEFSVPVPGWMHPGFLMATSVRAFVTAAEPLPDEGDEEGPPIIAGVIIEDGCVLRPNDYRVFEPSMKRETLMRIVNTQGENHDLPPFDICVLSQFSRFCSVWGKPIVILTGNGDANPIGIRIQGDEDFSGAFMPCRSDYVLFGKGKN